MRLIEQKHKEHELTYFLISNQCLHKILDFRECIFNNKKEISFSVPCYDLPISSVDMNLDYLEVVSQAIMSR